MLKVRCQNPAWTNMYVKIVHHCRVKSCMSKPSQRSMSGVPTAVTCRKSDENVIPISQRTAGVNMSGPSLSSVTWGRRKESPGISGILMHGQARVASPSVS